MPGERSKCLISVRTRQEAQQALGERERRGHGLSLGYGAHGSKHRVRTAPDAPALFDDTSGGYPSQPGGYAASGADVAFSVNHLLGDPMANVAMAYGSSIASQGKDMVHKELHRFVSMNKLKYFFAVDTAYVAKKLGLLVFPYTHQNWELRYSRDVPLPPRQDLNAPDLYIPAMAFVTYVLLAGMALGIQQRFSPRCWACAPARRSCGWSWRCWPCSWASTWPRCTAS